MDQGKMWDYYQNEGVDAFSGSAVRLRFLFRKAVGLAKGGRLTVLNIGVGNGWLERSCAGRGWDTSCLDPSERAIRRINEEGIPGIVGSIDGIPYESARFDVVFCSEVIEHLSEAQMRAGLAEIARVLKPGGHLIGSVPYNENLPESRVVCPGCGTVFPRWGHTLSFDKEKVGTVLADARLNVIDQGTRAFVEFSGGSAKNRLGMLIHRALGRVGSPLGTPTLYFVARKRPD